MLILYGERGCGMVVCWFGDGVVRWWCGVGVAWSDDGRMVVLCGGCVVA